MKPIIVVENLHKQYRLGARSAHYETIRESITSALKAPFRRTNGQQKVETIWALNGVSFEVIPGEILGIIGRNGAGKSTLLKVLSRITEPTSGKVRLYGRVGSLLEVGTGFHPELSGRENIFLNGAILGMSRHEIARKFDEIVAFAETEKFIDTPVKHYSNGMYMRLAFAVAAHLEPEILVVDEVLAVGDAAFQKRCLGKMGEVARRGRTVLFVSHQMSAITHLCTRAIVLAQGSIVFDAGTYAAVQRYLEELRSDSSGDLRRVEHRQGHGRVRLCRVDLIDDHGRQVDQVISGQTIGVELEYESRSDHELANCRVSIAVENLVGQPLIVCSTEMVTETVNDLPPCGRVRCMIPRLPLSQGRYVLTLFFEVNREVEDFLQSATTFDVVDGDFFGSGRQYPEGWQGKSVLVPHRWEAVT